jgi:DNA-binding MarR family transcriptional regulator
MTTETIDARTTQAGIRQTPVLAWLRLMRVFHKIEHRSADELRPHGLSLAQFDVLAHVGAREGMTQQELADSLLVTKGNICQLLGRMESSGLIERRQRGRANELALTEQGKRLFREVVPNHECDIADAMGSLSPEEQAELLALLRKLDRNLTWD